MKKLIIFFSISLMFGQNMNSEEEKQATKLDQLLASSNTIKFYNYDLGVIKQTYGAKLKCEVRKLHTASDITFFLQITKPGEYSNAVANIAEDDLNNLIEGMSILKLELPKDMKTDADYMENKYMTEDGLFLGYYISKGKSTWYMKLEKYGSNKTAFIKNINDLEAIFNQAKGKIEQLKS